MSQVIIYPDDFGCIAIVHPVAGTGVPIEQIALKDVPPGKPFRIIDFADLPEDQQYRSAWEADFTNPDGYGIGHDAWTELQNAVGNG